MREQSLWSSLENVFRNGVAPKPASVISWESSPMPRMIRPFLMQSLLQRKRKLVLKRLPMDKHGYLRES